MADENEIEIKVTASNESSGPIREAAKDAKDTGKQISKSMGDAGDSLGKTGKQAKSFGDRMSGVAAASFALTGGLGDLASSIGDVADVGRAGERRADELQRAYLDVEQASENMAQAEEDAKQAQENLNQAQIDGKQSAVDVEQAQIDAAQAALDTELAQDAYNEAVAKFGTDSAEARQAHIDLTQAQSDQAQAAVDAEQAAADMTQADLDAAQATRSLSQADIDAREAQLDLNEATRTANPPAVQQWTSDMLAYAPAVTAASGAVQLLTAATTALSLATIRSTAATAAAKIAQIAQAVATGVVTVAQWALNVAMTANPIGIIIVAIGALIAVIVLIATKTTWFQTAWKATWGAIKTAAAAVGSWFRDTLWGAWLKPVFDFVIQSIGNWMSLFKTIKARVVEAFSGIGEIMMKPFRGAIAGFKAIWNSTIGGRGFSLPGWLGGGSFTIPTLARGGITSGLAVVGERGAELLDLPAGSHVRPAANTAQALTGGGTASSQPTEMKIHFGGDIDGAFATAFMRMLRDGAITIRPQALEA